MALAQLHVMVKSWQVDVFLISFWDQGMSYPIFSFKKGKQGK